MKNPICGELMIFQTTSRKHENLGSWYIVNCVLNAFLCINAIILNSVTIQALRKTSSFPKPLKTLLLNLAVSDLGVGLLVQPFYFGLLVKWFIQRDNSYSVDGTCTTFLLTLYLFIAASFSGVVALSGDRFLAVHLHLRYQELVTHKRVVAVVISIWTFSAFLSLSYLWVSRNNFYMLIATVGVVYLVFSTIFYLKIYFAVRRHRNQVQALQVAAENDQIANAARLRKSAVSVFYVYLVFLLCYLPKICSFLVVVISGFSPGVKVVFSFSTTLLFLNSSLNPVIYCWKMKHIRRAVLGIVRNILRSHNNS